MSAVLSEKPFQRRSATLDKYSPSLETAFRIALVFGVALEKVFQYEAVKGRR